MCVWYCGSKKVKPKFAIFGCKMLFALMSQWMIHGWAISWKSNKPWTTPRQILNCTSQFRSWFLLCFLFVLENNIIKLRWSIWNFVTLNPLFETILLGFFLTNFNYVDANYCPKNNHLQNRGSHLLLFLNHKTKRKIMQINMGCTYWVA
jgi:hypothetical protein